MLNECNFCNHNVDDSCQLDVNGCETNMYEMFDGKIVRYKKANLSSQFGGKFDGEILTGKIQEVFKSQDGTFSCFWIENERELIVENQIINYK